MYYFIDNKFELNNFEYDKNDILEYRCEECGKLYTKRYVNLIISGLLCKNCCQKKAFNGKDWTDRLNKAKKTKLLKYGDENYNNIKQTKKTCLEKYGNEVAINSKTIQLKLKEKNLQMYGVEYSCQREDVKEKSRNTKIKRYNNPNYRNEEKIKQTCLEKYGTEYVVQSDYFKNKSKETCLNNGYTNGGYSDEARKKIHKKYTYEGLNFDSKPELEYYIWLKDHNVNFEYQPNVKFEYSFNGGIHYYYPDFKVNGILQEIKGLQFFENKNPIGKMINPYDRSQDDKYEAKHQCMLSNGIQIITDYTNIENYINETYTKDYCSLFRNDLEFPYINEKLVDKSDLGIIQHFHKSIYEAHRKNKPSPIEGWRNKDLIKKCALNRLKYVKRCKPSDILQGFNVAKIAPKISVFKPQLATDLIKKYLNEYTTIFDPFSGFSGRLIGAANCNKVYIGQDILDKHIQESQEIIKFKQYKNCYLTVQDILTDETKNYECLFTCPPYGGKEHWNKDNDEIEKTCDEWIEICLNKYKCKKYLFVVDKTEKYKDYIVDTITNKSHFGCNNEYIILIGD